MNIDLLFTIANTIILPAWILLIFFPSKSITEKLVFSHVYPFVLALFYAVFIIWGSVENIGGNGGMDSLNGLRIAFENDKVLLAAWIHYLVFDMFVGSWIAKDALSKKLSKIVVGICLVFTLMLGPVGFLLYKLYLSFTKQNQPTAV